MVMRLRHGIVCCAVLFAAMIALAHVENGIVYYTDINGSEVTRVSSEIAGNMTVPLGAPTAVNCSTSQPARSMRATIMGACGSGSCIWST